MKTTVLILLVISFALTACRTTYRETPAQKAEREARQEQERIAAEEARKLAEARAIEVAKTERAGTPVEVFLEAHGEPESEELIDGATVYRYSDGETPMIFVFKGGKLTSKMIDRERLRELAERHARREEADHRRRQSEEQERTRRLMIWQSMQNSRPAYQPTPAYQIPVRKTTNCTSQRFGNQIQTTCN